MVRLSKDPIGASLAAPEDVAGRLSEAADDVRGAAQFVRGIEGSRELRWVMWYLTDVVEHCAEIAEELPRWYETRRQELFAPGEPFAKEPHQRIGEFLAYLSESAEVLRDTQNLLASLTDASRGIARREEACLGRWPNFEALKTRTEWWEIHRVRPGKRAEQGQSCLSAWPSFEAAEWAAGQQADLRDVGQQLLVMRVDRAGVFEEHARLRSRGDQDLGDLDE